MATEVAAPPARSRVPVPAAAPSRSTPPSAPPAPAPAPTRSLLLILHGKRAADTLLADALADVRAQGHQVAVRVTFAAGDAAAFVAEAIQLNDAGAASYQTIVAGGGDGTLNECLCALMAHHEAVERQGLSLGLLPLGTANDVAACTGISVDPRVALRTALDPARIRRIDVARANDHFFINCAVAGGIAEVSPAELASRWKRLLGPVAIAGFVLRRLFNRRSLQPHSNARITLWPAASAGGSSSAGQPVSLNADLLLLVAGNSRQMGRTLAVAPDALLDDGLLDFTLLTGASLVSQLASLAMSLVTADDHAHTRGLAQFRAARLEVVAASDDVIPVQCDGEPTPSSNRLVFEVLHHALAMHLPDDRMLVSGQPRSLRSQAPGSHSIRGTILAADGASAVPAAEALAPPRLRPRRRGCGSQGDRHLRVRTLRRMLAVAGPAGRGVRLRAQLAGAGRKLATCLVLLAAGGAIGWAAGARRGGARERQAVPA